MTSRNDKTQPIYDLDSLQLHFALSFTNNIGQVLTTQNNTQRVARNLTGNLRPFKDIFTMEMFFFGSTTYGNIKVNIEVCTYFPEEGRCRSMPNSPVLSVPLAAGLSVFILLIAGLSVYLCLKKRRQSFLFRQQGKSVPTMVQMQSYLTLEKCKSVPTMAEMQDTVGTP